MAVARMWHELLPATTCRCRFHIIETLLLTATQVYYPRESLLRLQRRRHWCRAREEGRQRFAPMLSSAGVKPFSLTVCSRTITMRVFISTRTEKSNFGPAAHEKNFSQVKEAIL